MAGNFKHALTYGVAGRAAILRNRPGLRFAEALSGDDRVWISQFSSITRLVESGAGSERQKKFGRRGGRASGPSRADRQSVEEAASRECRGWLPEQRLYRASSRMRKKRWIARGEKKPALDAAVCSRFPAKKWLLGCSSDSRIAAIAFDSSNDA